MDENWHPNYDSKLYHSLASFERYLLGAATLFTFYLVYLFRYRNTIYLTIWNKMCFTFLFFTSLILMTGRLSWLNS